MDRPKLGLVHDHAYWLSGIKVAKGARSGLIDAISFVHGRGDPIMTDVLPAGTEPWPHVQLGLTPSPVSLRSASSNTLLLNLTDVAAVTVWPQAAGVRGGTVMIRSSSNAPATITLAGTFGTVSLRVPAGSATRVVRL
jgi:hypothetical protein